MKFYEFDLKMDVREAYINQVFTLDEYNIERKNKRKCVKIVHFLFIFLCECIKIALSIYAIS